MQLSPKRPEWTCLESPGDAAPCASHIHSDGRVPATVIRARARAGEGFSRMPVWCEAHKFEFAPTGRTN